MAFVKLLLVLAALTFGKNLRRKAGANDDIVLPSFSKGSLYYTPGYVSKGGVLTIDYKDIANVSLGHYATKLVSEFKEYGDGKADAEAFETIKKADLHFKKVSSGVLQSEADSCKVFDGFVDDDFYGQLGYTVFVIEGEDIAPSITGLIENAPKKITYKNKPSDLTDEQKEDFEDDSLTQNCGLSEFIDLAIAKVGVTDAVCQPNGALPADADKCADGKSPKYFLKGYKEAQFGNADIQALKDLLVRFGPVHVNDYDGAGSSTNFGIIVGWTQDDWIIVEGSGTSDYSATDIPRVEGKYFGQVFIDGVSAIRAALGLIAAVLVLPALLL